MCAHQRTCNHLLLLVGSNPFPNFLAALVLKPESISLFYSQETKEVKNYLWERLKQRRQGTPIEEQYIEDASCAARVREVFSRAISGAHLHYTGGTKVMAAHARMAFAEAGGRDEHASYLDERAGVLRFDDGYEIELPKQGLGLGLGDVLGLHGIELLSRDGQCNSPPTEQDVEKIATVVLRNPELARDLYDIHRKEGGKRRTFQEAQKAPANIGRLLNVDMSISCVPEDTWNKKTYEKWCDFLNGGWLENWCRKLVQKIVDNDEVSVSLNCRRANGRQLEIDLAVVRGHRIYVISCTTETKLSLCKSKIFEVAMRARQLGGDLARSALVCLLHGGDSKGSYVDQLRNDVADIWEARNTPQVFGLDDLREWAGMIAKPNTTSLKKWLDS